MNILWLLGLDVEISWWAVLLLLIGTYVIYTVRHYWTFWRIGIPVRPFLPLVGGMMELQRKGILAYTVDGLKYPDVHGEVFAPSMVGITIRNLDLIKEVFIKDFPNFTNRQQVGGKVTEFPFDSFLTILEDDDWKRVRSHVSPTFSASKMKMMGLQINEITEQLVKKLEEICATGDYFDTRAVSGSFTMDVIARTTYGLQINTQQDPNSDFVKHADKFMNINFARPAALAMFFFPFLTPVLKYLGFTLIDKEATDFFVAVTRQTIARRKETKESERDLLQLMIDAHEDSETTLEAGVKRGLSEGEVLAQGLLVFLAGYDTTANTLQFIMYNLATNPDDQEKLYQEICDVVGDKKILTYEMMNELPYLDMFLQETQRLYPIASRTNRVARESRTYHGTHIPAGMAVNIPIYALHMDPEVWPEPTKFRPERFLPEEKEKRSPYHYAPFGHGPRNCVGMRLALMEMKMAVVSIVRNFKLVTGPETEIPPKMEKVRTRADIKLKLERRETSTEE